MQTQTAKFNVGQAIVIQPTPQSQKLYGHVASVKWNESFREYAYGNVLTCGSYNTAWEREMHTENSSCPYHTQGCTSRRQCMKCKQAFGGTMAEYSADEREDSSE